MRIAVVSLSLLIVAACNVRSERSTRWSAVWSQDDTEIGIVRWVEDCTESKLDGDFDCSTDELTLLVESAPDSQGPLGRSTVCSQTPRDLVDPIRTIELDGDGFTVDAFGSTWFDCDTAGAFETTDVIVTRSRNALGVLVFIDQTTGELSFE